MPTSIIERVTNALKEYDNIKSRHSLYLSENPTITYLRNYLRNLEHLSATDENTMLESLLINHHDWDIHQRDDYISATDKCIISILVDDIQHDNSLYVRNAFVVMRRAGLLIGEQARANREAITGNGGKYAREIAQALSVLQRKGLFVEESLLTEDQAQANFDAITVNGGKYAPEIAQALHLLQNANLLIGEHAQTNRKAITGNDGKYAPGIAQALHSLQDANLSMGAQSQANFDAITVNGGEYAGSIAAALETLKYIYFFGGQAQAIFNAIAGNGGEYAGKISTILANLNASELLESANRKDNYERLNKYIECSTINEHGIGFIATVIGDNTPISQELYNLLTSTSVYNENGYDLCLMSEIDGKEPESGKIYFIIEGNCIKYRTHLTPNNDFASLEGEISQQNGELYRAINENTLKYISQQCKDALIDITSKREHTRENEHNSNESNIFLAALQNLNNEAEKVANSDIDNNNVLTQEDNTPEYGLDIRGIINLCEYIDTYFKEDGKNSNNIFHEISLPLINSVKEQTTIAMLNEIFKGLSNIDDIVEARGIINTIIAMIETNEERDSIFKVSTFNALAEVIDRPYQKKTDDDATQINASIIHLLGLGMYQHFDSFKKAWDFLCAVEEKPQDLLGNFGIFAVSKQCTRHDSFELVAAQETKSPG